MKKIWMKLKYWQKWTAIMLGFIAVVGGITYLFYRLQLAGIIG